MKVNRINLTDMAMDFAWHVMLPYMEDVSEPDEFVGGLVRYAIEGDYPAWFEEEVMAAEIELEDVSVLEFFQEVVVEFVKMVV